jgi:hypothetical protein
MLLSEPPITPFYKIRMISSSLVVKSRQYMPQNTLKMDVILSNEEKKASKILKPFSFYIKDQGWRTYGTHAQSGTWKYFLGKRHSLLCHFSNLILPVQAFYTVRNMRICITLVSLY